MNFDKFLKIFDNFGVFCVHCDQQLTMISLECHLFEGHVSCGKQSSTVSIKRNFQVVLNFAKNP